MVTISGSIVFYVGHFMTKVCPIFLVDKRYICNMLNAQDVITVSPDIMGNQPVFKGTRVTVETLFDYLENGETIEAFLLEFPSVTREQAMSVIEIASKLLSSRNIIKLYETAA